MTDAPTPTLERTSAEIRDRAVSEANVLRQENAELRSLVLPLAAHADAMRRHFTHAEWAALEPETHLVAEGITLNDCLRARKFLSKPRQ